MKQDIPRKIDENVTLVDVRREPKWKHLMQSPEGEHIMEYIITARDVL